VQWESVDVNVWETPVYGGQRAGKPKDSNPWFNWTDCDLKVG
jgi:hypothetical protein